MPRHMRFVLAVATLLGSASAVSAQAPAKPTYQPASLVMSGTLLGSIRDEQGRALGGAMVSVLGGSLTKMEVTDAKGRFALALPAGNYVLKATRDGYSARRGDIIVAASRAIELNITMTRQPAGTPADRPVMLAGVGGATATSARQPSGSDAGKTDATASTIDELGWRMRQLPRTALRDVSPSAVPGGQSKDFKGRGSLFDWAVLGSARAATSYFTTTPFTGQLNFMTSSTLGVAPGMPQSMPRGIAYGVVGAPIGTRGDWTMRAAMNSGDWSSWAVLGAYQARSSETHAIGVGLSFSAQSYAGTDSASVAAAQATSRSAGGMYAFDHWRVAPRIELDYGGRFDRFDYVPGGMLISPRVGARVGVMPTTFLVGSMSQRMVAPGAEEFLPPVTGPWLPPEHTFDPLGSPTFTAERVRHDEVGLEQVFGHRSLGVRYFRESTWDQMVTVFGGEGGLYAPPPGHFGVATAGNVESDGWDVRASGEWVGRFTGRVDYATAQAHWFAGDARALLAAIEAPASRSQSGRIHDLTTTLEARIPESDTRVVFAYRIDSAFGQPGLTQAQLGLGTRFDLQIHQGLPFRPIGGSRMELLVAVRNMFHDLREPGSMFDELLTVAPPLRVIGGLQIRF